MGPLRNVTSRNPVGSRNDEWLAFLVGTHAAVEIVLLFEVGSGPPHDRVRRPGAAIFMAHSAPARRPTCRTLYAVTRASSPRDITRQWRTGCVLSFVVTPRYRPTRCRF